MTRPTIYDIGALAHRITAAGADLSRLFHPLDYGNISEDDAADRALEVCERLLVELREDLDDIKERG